MFFELLWRRSQVHEHAPVLSELVTACHSRPLEQSNDECMSRYPAPPNNCQKYLSKWSIVSEHPNAAIAQSQMSEGGFPGIGVSSFYSNLMRSVLRHCQLGKLGRGLLRRVCRRTFHIVRARLMRRTRRPSASCSSP